jgi:hypothetical protein
MALLEYISDEDLFNEVETLLIKAKKKKDAAEKTFNSNVIDPFGALFEARVSHPMKSGETPNLHGNVRRPFRIMLVRFTKKSSAMLMDGRTWESGVSLISSTKREKSLLR